MKFTDWLGTVADILGIITALVAVPTVIRFLFYELKRRKTIKKLMNDSGRRRSAVFGIGLGATATMESQVRTFVNSHPAVLAQVGKELRKEENFFLLEKPENLPEIAADEKSLYNKEAEQYVHEFLQEISATMVLMAKNGISRIHLFYQGPAILAAPLGAALANRFTVICYHNSRQIGYYAVGLLQEPLL